MQDDTAKAKEACQDFLTLWKDAEPDIPVLEQAKAEYAKLQWLSLDQGTLAAAWLEYPLWVPEESNSVTT